MDIYDIYGLQIDVDKKRCYTCKKESTCKCRTFEEAIACNYVIKPEVRKITSKIKPL